MFECKKNKVHGLAGSQLPRNRWYTWQMTTVTFQSGSPATPSRSSSRVRNDQTATSKMDVAWPFLSQTLLTSATIPCIHIHSYTMMCMFHDIPAKSIFLSILCQKKKNYESWKKKMRVSIKWRYPSYHPFFDWDLPS